MHRLWWPNSTCKSSIQNVNRTGSTQAAPIHMPKLPGWMGTSRGRHQAAHLLLCRRCGASAMLALQGAQQRPAAQASKTVSGAFPPAVTCRASFAGEAPARCAVRPELRGRQCSACRWLQTWARVLKVLAVHALLAPASSCRIMAAHEAATAAALLRGGLSAGGG